MNFSQPTNLTCVPAERIIACCMLRGQSEAARADAEAFTSFPESLIYRAARQYYVAFERSSVSAVAETMRAVGVANADEILATLLELNPTPAGLYEALNSVQETWRRRRLFALADEVAPHLVEMRLAATGVGSRASVADQAKAAVEVFIRAAHVAESIASSTPTAVASQDILAGTFGATTAFLAAHELSVLALYNRDMARAKPPAVVDRFWELRRTDLLLARSQMFAEQATAAGAPA